MKGYSSEIFQEKFYSDKIIQSTPAGNFFPGNFPNKLENRSSQPEVFLRKIVFRKYAANVFCNSENNCSE